MLLLVLVIAGVSIPRSAQAQCDASFAAPDNIAAGTGPQSLAIGLLNADTAPDVVAANIASNNISVFLNDGSGGLIAAGSFATAAGPAAVAIGNFNGDSALDLVTANSTANNVSVLLGNGDGTFIGSTQFTAGTTPGGIAVGHFNADTALDLAVANIAGNNVSVLLGNGNGTFQSPTNFNAGSGPISVAVADLNGDTFADLVTANSNSDNVSILLGNGNGTFQGANNVAVNDGPVSVAVGGLNGDNFADLVVANSNSDDVSVLLGNGNGTFQQAVNVGAGDSPFAIALGDVNDDGSVDAAVANSLSSNVSVLLGNGAGNLEAPDNFAVGALPRAVAISDLGADGRPDLVTANLSANTISLLSNNTAVIINAVCQNVTVSADGTCQAVVAAAAVNNGSAAVPACAPLDFSLSPPGPFALGDTLVTLTVTGQFGASQTCQATITVQDTTGPAITCPPDANLLCNEATDPSVTGTATATDPCDPAPVINFSDVTTDGAIARTWTATDAAGNVSTCVQNIARSDAPAPTITCPANASIACGAASDPSVTGSATATDACDPAPDIVFTDVESPGVGGGVITRTWTATSDLGLSSSCDQIITRVDTSLPVITCPQDASAECGSSLDPAVLGGPATGSDSCDPAPVIAFSDLANPAVGGGTVTRTWTITDASGNAATCQQTISLSDTTPPVITCPADATIECGTPTDPATVGAAVVVDACDAAASATFVDSIGAGTCGETQTITRTWTATDASGHTATCTHVLTLADTTPPTINCPENMLVQPGERVEYEPSATDACDPDPQLALSLSSGFTMQEGSTSVTVAATDACGNTGTCTFSVTVQLPSDVNGDTDGDADGDQDGQPDEDDQTQNPCGLGALFSIFGAFLSLCGLKTRVRRWGRIR